MENIIFAVLVLGAIAIVFGLILSRRLRGSDPRRQGSRHRLRARRRGGRCQDRRDHGHGSAQR